ncbi:MAG: 3-phosphoglycerate dehydrogenase [Lachnospiraceae bacterium]|nr:3-phosphoglycerate dehydrogenase [Lachnospiraceae bacterium]
MKMKILSSYPAPEEGFAPFRDEFDITVPEKPLTHDDLVKMVGEYDGLYEIVIKIDKEIIDACAAGKCKVIANNGVGYDNVDVAYATEKGIAIVNTPTQVTEATAEHSATLIFAVMRNVARFDKEVRRHVWDSPFFPTRSVQVEGSTLGVIGFGRIGKRVAVKAQGMGMNVIYYDAFRAPEEVEKEFGVTYMPFDEVIKTADCITIHVPYTPENHHLFNAEIFKKMKKDSFLVNCSRGPVVDEAALAEALKNEEIKGAGLDVFEHEPHPLEELLSLDNVTLTAHCASGTWKTRINMMKEAIEGLCGVLRGEVPYNVVNKEVFK